MREGGWKDELPQEKTAAGGSGGCKGSRFGQSTIPVVASIDSMAGFIHPLLSKGCEPCLQTSSRETVIFSQEISSSGRYLWVTGCGPDGLLAMARKLPGEPVFRDSHGIGKQKQGNKRCQIF